MLEGSARSTEEQLTRQGAMMPLSVLSTETCWNQAGTAGFTIAVADARVTEEDDASGAHDGGGEIDGGEENQGRNAKSWVKVKGDCMLFEVLLVILKDGPTEMKPSWKQCEAVWQVLKKTQRL